MNRLASERSPYLLQHAGNPVDWYPWNDEAFARARAEDKPIFLSIGYSTCHWCHVMEHESFESEGVASVLNRHFVAIKVDREERPDVDRVYMAFVQATTGSGGWPMSVWLTPELKPFYGGTYFPPSSRWGRPGFVDILEEIARVWDHDRARVRESADEVTARLKAVERSIEPATMVPQADALARTAGQFQRTFDPRHGGFGQGPKFPRPSELLFLFREYARTGDPAPRDVALATLRAMALGGIRDHVGGGFHRYAVDGAWRVPHFEKMLYDQAQLVLAYIEAAQVSADLFYLDVAEDTLVYVMRDMTHGDGGWFSAEDADSVPPEQAREPSGHKAEGAFYLWRDDELDAIVGADAPLVRRRFGIEPGGNAPVDPQQEFTGKNLLYVARSIEELADETGSSPAEIAGRLDHSRRAMFEARSTRPRPHLDDKVLTAWNGLMLAAFARAARVIRALAPGGRDGEAYLEAARRAARFLRARMWDPERAVLRRRFRDGHAEIDGYAEDYAYLTFGLLELFQADPDPTWLSWAVGLQRRQDELFWDAGDGGWFSTTGADPTVLLRMKEDYDGAEPSASSVSVMNLLVLSHLVEEDSWTGRIERTLRCFAGRLEQIGTAVPMMGAALATYLHGMQQIVLVEGPGCRDLARETSRRHLPFAIVLSMTPAQRQALSAELPFIAGMRGVEGRGTAYVCRRFTCLPPVTEVAALAAALEETR